MPDVVLMEDLAQEAVGVGLDDPRFEDRLDEERRVLALPEQTLPDLLASELDVLTLRVGRDGRCRELDHEVLPNSGDTST